MGMFLSIQKSKHWLHFLTFSECPHRKSHSNWLRLFHHWVSGDSGRGAKGVTQRGTRGFAMVFERMSWDFQPQTLKTRWRNMEYVPTKHGYTMIGTQIGKYWDNIIFHNMRDGFCLFFVNLNERSSPLVAMKYWTLHGFKFQTYVVQFLTHVFPWEGVLRSLFSKSKSIRSGVRERSHRRLFRFSRVATYCRRQQQQVFVGIQWEISI